MQFPNPTDAFLNPVQYWTDVYATQVELARTTVDFALAFNPLFPEGEFAPFWASFPPVGAGHPSPVRAPAAKAVTKKAVSAKPKVKARSTTPAKRAVKLSSAKNPQAIGRRSARKAVTLPPGPPSSKNDNQS